MDDATLEQWTVSQLSLLQLEKEAEAHQLSEKISKMTAIKAQDMGISLLNLHIVSTQSALMGRNCHTLGRIDDKTLPSHTFKVGDEILLYSSKLHTTKDETNSLFGIISKISVKEIDILCEVDDTEHLLIPLRLDMNVSEVTHKKMVTAVHNLSKISHPMINIIFNKMEVDLSVPLKIVPYNVKLNPSQVEAVEHALGSPQCALIHGPPGTGKTSTVIELILQYVKLGSRLLVCCGSNTAVDTILQRLAHNALMNKAVRCVRLGHPARINKSILSYCLDSLVVEDAGTEIVREVRGEIDAALRNMLKTRERARRDEFKTELRELRKEARRREAKVVDTIIRSRNVILCTNVGASSKLLREQHFDVCIIDEAAQALEASCWIPIVQGRTCIMFGDHKQLPPTIKSAEASRGGLSVTLFEKIMRSGRLAHVSRLLDTQYRMHKMIADWASNSSYQGKLMTDESIAGHVLLDLNGVDRALLEETESASPMLLIDTSGCCMEEDQGDSASHSNRMEAQVVEAYVMSLLEAGIRAEHIGVITPYNGQLELLKGIFCEKFPALEVKTVDGFQGGEKEAIVISFVRSNEKREVGFLSDERRINVAVTRAKRQVAIICDVETCSSDPFLRSLLTYMSFNGDHRTAFDFMESPITQAPSKTDCNLTIFGCKVSDNVGFEPPDNVGLPEPKTKKKAATFVLNKRNSHATSKLSLSEYNSIVDAALLDVVEQIAQRSISGGTVRIVPYHIARLEKLDSKSIVSLGVGDSALVVEFPHSLTSFQRMTLHALADKLGLFHRSSGEDIARLLQISSQDFEVTTNPLDLNLNLSLDEFSSGKNTSDVKDFEGQKDLRVRPTVKSIEVKKVALRPAYVSAQKEVYMSTDRLAQQQKLIAIDDEEAMLEAAIQQNSAYEDSNKYRVSLRGGAMPHFDRSKNQNALRNRLAEAQRERTRDPVETKKSSGGKSRGKK